MDNKKTFNFMIVAIVFSLIFGVLLHFLFEISDYNRIIGLFSAVNESVWEHLKLIFFPMFIITILGYFYIGKNLKNYICSRTIGIVSAMLFVIIFFYTYTGILGFNIALFDIGSFVIAIILGEYISYKTIKSENEFNSTVCILILIATLLCFVRFTFNPIKINLFKDPITGNYGIDK